MFVTNFSHVNVNFVITNKFISYRNFRCFITLLLYKQFFQDDLKDNSMFELAHWKIILIIWLKVTGCTLVRFWQFSYTHGHKNWTFVHQKNTKKSGQMRVLLSKVGCYRSTDYRSCSWGFHISGKGNSRICSPRTIALVVWIPLGAKWVEWVIKGENLLLLVLWSTVYKMLWIALRT